jgi:hypothetical protein
VGWQVYVYNTTELTFEDTMQQQYGFWVQENKDKKARMPLSNVSLNITVGKDIL